MKLSAGAIFPAPLDRQFQPAFLFNRRQLAAVKKSRRATPLVLGLERENGLVSRYETVVLAEPDAATLFYAERLVKFLLWAWGGWQLHVGGPAVIGAHLGKLYSPRGARRFDGDMMTRAYGKKFRVRAGTAEQVPAARESQTIAGGHWQGCRLGFDLGASDYKVCAVADGRVVFSAETPWDPKSQPDPEYHYRHLSAGLRQAAAHLPRVDAIGGSSAGIIVDNEIRVASLLRAVPKNKFAAAAGMFKRLQREWNVPVAVLNDGDVTALAGALAGRKRGMLGIALGSSQAAGFLDRQGRIPGWLNELAFAPVDYNPAAAADEWSGDLGVGALYFSQQAVNRLLPAARIKLPPAMGLPERLQQVQNLMAGGDGRAERIYETIGVYLGCALPHYADFYDFKHLLLLGRVTSGAGGEVLLAAAQKTLATLAARFPETATKLHISMPDEKSRRVGQAVAAASLPADR